MYQLPSGSLKLFLIELIRENGKKCAYCGDEIFLEEEISKDPKSARERQLRNVRMVKRATIDHKFPISKGGDKLDVKNMKACCLECNRKKRDRGYKSFLKGKKKGVRE